MSSVASASGHNSVINLIHKRHMLIHFCPLAFFSFFVFFFGDTLQITVVKDFETASLASLNRTLGSLPPPRLSVTAMIPCGRTAVSFCSQVTCSNAP